MLFSRGSAARNCCVRLTHHRKILLDKVPVLLNSARIFIRDIVKFYFMGICPSMELSHFPRFCVLESLRAYADIVKFVVLRDLCVFY